MAITVVCNACCAKLFESQQMHNLVKVHAVMPFVKAAVTLCGVANNDGIMSHQLPFTEGDVINNNMSCKANVLLMGAAAQELLAL